MPALDQCHDQVIRAFQKDGWQVERAPFRVSTPSRTVFVDVRFTHRSNGITQQIVLIEIKCFPDDSSITQELYGAIGQYLIYRAMLAERQMPDPIFLSIPEDIYTRSFDPAVQRVINEGKINVVIVNIYEERIVQWIQH